MSGSGTSDEARLVTLIKQGDSQAFETLYERYAQALMYYSETILKDKDAAFEVVQDTFVAVWMNRHKLISDKPVRNYLLRAVHNNSLRQLKRDSSRRAVEKRAADGEELVFRPEDQSNTETFYHNSLLPAIEGLPDRSRKIFEMSFRDEMKSKDVAAALSISVRTVESVLYKIRKRLRGELKSLDNESV